MKCEEQEPVIINRAVYREDTLYHCAWERLHDELCEMLDSYAAYLIKAKMDKIIKELQE